MLCADGTVFSGCNVENASSGLTVCAERVAVMSAVAAGRRQFEALAVVTDAEPPASLCGACRQVLHEFAPQATVLLANTSGNVIITSAAELLPRPFGPDGARGD